MKCQNSEQVSCHAEFLTRFYTWKCPYDEWRRISQGLLSLLSVVQGHTLGCPLLGLGRKFTISFTPTPHYHSNMQTLIRKLLIEISPHCKVFHENHDMCCHISYHTADQYMSYWLYINLANTLPLSP